jgi:endonuclease/exonuclease/phosphatase (EEP) superfamily protein YafD
VYNTHAESGNNEGLRARQLMEILEAERSHGNLQAVIAGDLNTSFTSGALLRHFEDAAFANAIDEDRSPRPTSRGRIDPIDWVLAKGLSVREATIVETSWSVSDHRPVVAALDRVGSRDALPTLVSNPFDLDTALSSEVAASR